jgi:hypothetical protein
VTVPFAKDSPRFHCLLQGWQGIGYYLKDVGSLATINTCEAQMAPAVLRSGPYRFYFVSHDLHEPAHVHVDRDAYSAKFWINPVALAYNLGYPPRELRRIESIIWSNSRS